jgi:tetratricopeptide (TPR) repeat protein
MRVLIPSTLAGLFMLCAAAAAAPAGGAAGSTKDTDEKALTLVAELALQRGNCLEAADAYVRAAAAATDAALAKRATEVGVGCEQWPRALAAAERWRELVPGDATVARTAGVVALKLHHLGEARDAFAVMLGLAGKNAEKMLVELIPLAAQTSDPVSAFTALKDFGADPKLSAGTLSAFATLGLEADNFAEARGFAERALKLDPGERDAAIVRVKLLVGEGEGDATAALAAARELAATGEEGTAFIVAETLADLDQREEARAELERLAQVEATRVEAERRLALLAYRNGDFETARSRFAEIYGRREGSTEALYYLSLIAELQGETEAALSGYEQLAGSDAGSLARVRAATLLMRAGDREHALAVLDDPQGNSGNGRTVIDTGIEKAQVLSENGAAPEAVKLLDELLKKFPGHPQLLYERATALERAGRVRDSVAAFEAILKDRPQDSMIENALGYTLADHKLQLARAEELIRAALAIAPDSAAILDSLGWVRYRRSDAKDALPELERAYRLGQDAEIAAHWGEVLWSAGRQTEARAVWTHSLALAPESLALKAVIARFVPGALPAAAHADVAPAPVAPAKAAPPEAVAPSPAP